MKSRYSPNDILMLKDRDIFFDANVLIYIFFHTGKTPYEKAYSDIYTELLRQRNGLFLDFMVISEVVNRVHRIDYDNYLTSKGITANVCKYKEFRNSDEGTNALKEIFSIVEETVLNHFQVVGKSLEKDDIISFLRSTALDFNDKAYSLLCKEKDMVFLTHDSDFRNEEIEILSINPKMIT